MLSVYVCRSRIALCSGGQTISKVAMRFLHQPSEYSSINLRQASNQIRTSAPKTPTATPSTSLKELVFKMVSKRRPAAYSRSLKEIFMAPAGQGGMIILQTQ